MCLMLTCQCVRTQISAGIWQLLIQEVAQLDPSRGSDLLSGILLGGPKVWLLVPGSVRLLVCTCKSEAPFSPVLMAVVSLKILKWMNNKILSPNQWLFCRVSQWLVSKF